MRLRFGLASAAVLIASGLLSSPTQFRAQEPSGSRKLLVHPAPPYPPLARNMSLAGIVKADVLVAPDGSAKLVSILGGHPVLAQAAVNTLLHWKWGPGAHETHEIVQVKFSRPE